MKEDIRKEYVYCTVIGPNHGQVVRDAWLWCIVGSNHSLASQGKEISIYPKVLKYWDTKTD